MSVIRSRRWRWLLMWCLAAQQFLIGGGIPLPSPATVARSAERYPCEDCGCGCRSAEQCWRHCCCLTNRQKIDWASRNGVAVPDYVLAAAERETGSSQHPGCLNCPPASSPKPESPPASPWVPANQRREQRERSGICLLRALDCHGLNVLWQRAVLIGPVDRQPRMQVVLLPTGRTEPEPLFKYLFLPPAPPTPPPRPVETADA
jgi:hypothetical protein